MTITPNAEIVTAAETFAKLHANRIVIELRAAMKDSPARLLIPPQFYEAITTRIETESKISFLEGFELGYNNTEKP